MKFILDKHSVLMHSIKLCESFEKIIFDFRYFRFIIIKIQDYIKYLRTCISKISISIMIL